MCAFKRLNFKDNNLRALTYNQEGSQLCQPDKNDFSEFAIVPFSTGAKVWFKHNEVVHFALWPSKIYHILCYNTILVTDRQGSRVGSRVA